MNRLLFYFCAGRESSKQCRGGRSILVRYQRLFLPVLVFGLYGTGRIAQLTAATTSHPGLLADTLVSTNAITNQVVPPYNPAPAPGTSEAEIQFQATNQPS